MRKKWLLIIVPLALVVAGACGVIGYSTLQAQSAAVNAVPAREATVAHQAITATLGATGNLQPASLIAVASETGGLVTHVAIKPGDVVTAGQTLATLDAADLSLALDEARQALRAQELTLARLKAPASEMQQAEAEAGLAAAQAQLTLARTGPTAAGLAAAQLAEEQAWRAYLQADALRNAVQDNPATPFDERAPADASAGLASVNYQIARYQRPLAEQGPSAAGIAAAQAQVAQARANLERFKAGAAASDIRNAELQLAIQQNAVTRAELALAAATLVAPCAGIVDTVVEPGARLAPGAPAIVIVDDRAFHLDVAVDELDVARLQPGQPVTVTVDALKGLALPATVAEIARSATSTGGAVTYAVRVDLAQADPRLRAGMTATALVVTERIPDALVVPNWALRFDRATGQAYVSVRRDAAVVEVPVTLGLRADTHSQVLTGVNEGDVVVEPVWARPTPAVQVNLGG